MHIRLFLVFCFCLGPVCLTFGQEENSQDSSSKKHFVFYNITNLVDPNGSSLQFGYNLEYKPTIDFQLEVGFVSDNILDGRRPFDEYAGFRIRPQIKFLTKKDLFNPGRFYGGLMLSYQQLTYKENNNFIIDDSFNQNITYQGKDKIYAWYLVGGIDGKMSSRILLSFSIGLGQVFIDTKVNEGDIPQNATLIDNCLWFCPRRNSAANGTINRMGALLDFKVGYMF